MCCCHVCACHVPTPKPQAQEDLAKAKRKANRHKEGEKGLQAALGDSQRALDACRRELLEAKQRKDVDKDPVPEEVFFFF